MTGVETITKLKDRISAIRALGATPLHVFGSTATALVHHLRRQL